VFGRFRRKKETDDTKEGLEKEKGDISPKSNRDEGRSMPKYTFRRPREEAKVNLMEVLGGLIQRLKSLDRQRTDVEEDIYQLGGEAQKEAENLEKELSTLKEQTRELEEVLNAIHAHRKVVRYRESGH
jgi:DNA repair exonuclease SbcCD ATPase subunit